MIPKLRESNFLARFGLGHTHSTLGPNLWLNYVHGGEIYLDNGLEIPKPQSPCRHRRMAHRVVRTESRQQV